jgi:regulatory protein
MTVRPRRRVGGSYAGPAGPTPGSPADSGSEPDAESVARTIVLRRLTDAPRSRAELASDLASRDVPEEVAERVLDRFTEVGLVDDAAFATAWVQSRHATRGLSRSALRRELRGKGVDDATVGAAVDEIGDDDEEAAARSLVARRLPGTRGLAREARVRRLVGQLARKGYPGGLAVRVVREALATEGDDLAGDDMAGDGADYELDGA